jgi:predicted esterase
MRCTAWLILLGGIIVTGVTASAQTLVGHHDQVSVAEPTRMDWIFSVANQSPARPLGEWQAAFDSTEQRYELFVPTGLSASKPAPLILFISANDRPAGWSRWQSVCQQAGVLFASPYGAGNNCELPKRVRIVLDVLDDIARRRPVDPDRIYLVGFSGGARVACGIAFALPEYFGGVIGVCGSERLRDESWLRQRVADRISVALVTGEQDFNRNELELLRGPLLSDVGVRTKVWVAPRMGHAIPESDVFADVLKWLDQGAAARGRMARQWPAMRIGGSDVPSRSQWADLLLKEARSRIQKPATLYSGLMQLQGVSTRWPDVPAAAAARELLVDFKGRTERPWEKDDLAEQRRFLMAEARALDRYGCASFPAQYAKERPAVLGKAIELWEQLRDDRPVSPEGQEAALRIPVLQRMLSDAGQPSTVDR